MINVYEMYWIIFVAPGSLDVFIELVFLQEKGFGVEHHLHRGRPLAAFNHILGVRASKLKSSHVHKEVSRQANIQSDVQAILAPLTQSEGSLLSSV